jgi:GT2 family glycosyltransferase
LITLPNVRVLTWNHPFNYAALNNFGASQARGELLLFLNNDVEAIHPDWLERMAEHALRPEVGAVGAKLYYPDDTLQHAGVVVGLREILGHVHRHFPRGSAGYGNRLAVVQNLSAVTAACLLTRRAVFEEINGFDEQFALDFNDIDLCLRLGQRGYRIVWTPHAELYHFESKTRGYALTEAQQIRFMRETHLFQTQWAGLFRDGDPYYNPNLTREYEDFSLRRTTPSAAREWSRIVETPAAAA